MQACLIGNPEHLEYGVKSIFLVTEWNTISDLVSITLTKCAFLEVSGTCFKKVDWP